MATKLIAESGATKCSWALLQHNKKKLFTTPGLSPYHLPAAEIGTIIRNELLPGIKNTAIDEIYFYGTGLAAPANRRLLKKILAGIFHAPVIAVDTDLTASAHATCGNSKGLVSILGTGSGIAYFDGRRIAKVQNGIGYVLGDEGSGAYLGRKVIQYFLYNTFDDELMAGFREKYQTDRDEILKNVYRNTFAGRYMASFTHFLSEHRGHYMIENIIEDGLNDFIVARVYKFRESWLYPLHFTGGVAYAFRDVLQELCNNYELEMGNILQYPIDGLIGYYQ